MPTRLLVSCLLPENSLISFSHKWCAYARPPSVEILWRQRRAATTRKMFQTSRPKSPTIKLLMVVKLHEVRTR
ncbi:hypothetical protein P154DRAFT_521027 [Amniculicola lignicola CBS 123094]|uniref:Uncharacterized protein n=1 Tax=Amniculicola lignicola CBS 123094 TaxID=1392246 RepID=A0A6A5WLH1_9PLEO|nr:hypothetical protein P154DRAFT_521027 [Amniculicola lignicola CBS 123094]